MPEYELRLRFTAADDAQAQRLAEAWAGTCAAEYSTRYAGVHRVEDGTLCAERGHMPLLNGGCQVCGVRPPGPPPVACEWCGRAIRQVAGLWMALKADERGYDPLYCDAADDTGRHEYEVGPCRHPSSPCCLHGTGEPANGPSVTTDQAEETP